MPKLSAPILAAIERFERETGCSVADELPDESEAMIALFPIMNGCPPDLAGSGDEEHLPD